MRRCVLRCLLPAFFAVFSALPAAASSIPIGLFSFAPDPFCSEAVADCEPAGLFSVENFDSAELAELIFSAVLLINGVPYDHQFLDPIGASSPSSTFTLDASPFGIGVRFSLALAIENPDLFPGQISLSNDLFEEVNSQGQILQSFSANVLYDEDGPAAVTETPSLFVIGLGLGALVIGRALISQ